MTESKNEALSRIRESFTDLSHYTHGVAQSYISGLVVVGEPGIGKTHNVRTAFHKYQNQDRFEIFSGTISSPVLYKKLYQYRHKGNVLVFDDCEVKDVESLDLLLAALDSKDHRTVSWNKESAFLKRESVPSKFDFEGGIIFLTNTHLMDGKAGKTKNKMAALISRCHYLDMTMSVEDKMIRIYDVVFNGNMLERYDLDEVQTHEIVNYVTGNANEMRELSLRTIEKVADLYVAYPKRWRRLADIGCKV